MVSYILYIHPSVWTLPIRADENTLYKNINAELPVFPKFDNKNERSTTKIKQF